MSSSFESTIAKKTREFFWSAFSRIRAEYVKIRTRKTLNTDTFQAMIVFRANGDLFLHLFYFLFGKNRHSTLMICILLNYQK